MKSLFGLSAALALLVSPAVAETVLYDNFGPGYGRSGGGHWFGPTGPSTWGDDTYAHTVVANGFVPSQTGQFDRFIAAIDDTYDLGAVVRLRLRDAPPDTPGQILWATFFAIGDYYDPEDRVVRLTDINGPTLAAGTEYWIDADGLVMDALPTWAKNQQFLDPYAVSFDGGATWNTYRDSYENFAMSIATPEPTTLMLLGVGCLAAIAGRWRPRRTNITGCTQTRA